MVAFLLAEGFACSTLSAWLSYGHPSTENLAVQMEGRAEIKQPAATRVAILTHSNPGATILASNSLQKLATGATSAVVAATYCTNMDAHVSATQLIRSLVQAAFGGGGGNHVNQLIQPIQQHCAGAEQVAATECGRALERAHTLGVLPST